MDKIQIKKDSKILFIGDSITDPKFNFRMMKDIKGRNIYALQLKKRFKKYSKDVIVEGRYPEAENEISLTTLIADKVDMGLGIRIEPFHAVHRTQA